MRSAPVSEFYVAEYLRHNAARQAAPHTVGTFLARRLKGRAGNYKGHYERRILKRLEALEAAGHAKRVRSAGGRTAWLPID